MAATPKTPTVSVRAQKPAHVPRARTGRASAKPAPEPMAAEVVETAPRAFFLIGENKKLSGDVAEHEWGWKRTKTGWSGPVGDIRFLADFAAVKKEAEKGPGPIAVFEGYRWYATIAPHLLHDLIKGGTVVKIAPPVPV